MENDGPIQNFVRWFVDVRRLSEETAYRHVAILRKFGEFLISRKRDALPAAVATATAATEIEIGQMFLEAKTDDIKAFLDSLAEMKLSDGTMINKLGALKTFYKFLVKTKQLSFNPAVSVKLPQRKGKLPRFLECEEVKKLLDAPPQDNWLGARDRAILETLYGTGIRVSEIVALNMDDLDFLGEFVHIRPEGKKSRIAPLSSRVLQAIQHYIESRDRQMQNNLNFDCKCLFVDQDGKRINTDSVRAIMKEYLKKAGLDMTFSPYILRHSFAVHMISNGADLRCVQELLGLMKLSSVRVYKERSDLFIKQQRASAR